MSEKGRYRVNLVKINDVSKLMSLLKDFKWFGMDINYEIYYINIIDQTVCKGFSGFSEDIFGGYCSVTYEEMIEILSKQKDLGDNAKKLLDKIQSSTFEELDARATKAHEKETLKQNLEILNDHLLNGTRIQFNCSGDQWHNVTGKFKLDQLKHKSIKLRVRPDRVEVDGVMMKPDAAIKYINKHYNMEVGGDKH